MMAQIPASIQMTIGTGGVLPAGLGTGLGGGITDTTDTTSLLIIILGNITVTTNQLMLCTMAETNSLYIITMVEKDFMGITIEVDPIEQLAIMEGMVEGMVEGIMEGMVEGTIDKLLRATESDDNACRCTVIEGTAMMKRTLSATLFLVLTVSLAAVSFVRADAKAEQEVKDFLTQYKAAYDKKDVSALMKMIAPEVSIVFFEADDKGRYVGPSEVRAAYKDNFEQIKSVKSQHKWTSIGSKGDIAWFATEVLYNVDTGKEKFEELGRWTGVLEKKDGKWLLIQSHFSFPPEEDSTPEKN